MAATMATSGVTNLNNINMFHDDGVHEVEKYLPLLAKLFVDHKMNESYAVGYLHRHFDIPATSIWLHEQVGAADRVLAKDINSLDMSKVAPHGLCLEDGQFKPFEYEVASAHGRQALSPEFLEALKDFAVKNGLVESLAIFPRTNKIMVESMLASGGQISFPEDATKPLAEGITSENTQWVFDAPLSGEPAYKTQQRCTINVHGFHFVHDDVVDSAKTTIGVQQRCHTDKDNFHTFTPDEVAALVSDGPLGGDPNIKVQQKCTINVHGFHFVHDDAVDAAATEAGPLGGEPSVKVQQKCTINVHGFHFVHDDAVDSTAVEAGPLGGEPNIKVQQKCLKGDLGIHYTVRDEAGTATQAGPLSGEPNIKVQQKCLKGDLGIHYTVRDEADAATEAGPLSGEPTIKVQQKCTINVHGFHFVHDD